MSNLEKRVYKSWAFTKDELEKRNINSLIYKELSEKYKISHSSRQYNSILKRMEDVKLDDYDIVLDRTSCYGHSKYRIVKNNTDLSRDELALICDRFPIPIFLITLFSSLDFYNLWILSTMWMSFSSIYFNIC